LSNLPNRSSPRTGRLTTTRLPPERARAIERRRFVIVPPSGIASRALMTRFITTCSICPRSALIEIGPACSFSTTVTSARVSRSSIVCISAMTRIRSNSVGSMICLRLNASS
jgi:hypothetical protein